MLNTDFLKGYIGGIISATDSPVRALDLCNNVLELAVHFDCNTDDIKAAKTYCENLISLLYGD